MGGTRFVGKPLVSRLLQQGHSLTLFTRGRQPVPDGVEAVNGDRGDDQALDQLKGRLLRPGDADRHRGGRVRRGQGRGRRVFGRGVFV